MKKDAIVSENKNLNNQLDKITLKNKVIEKSLDVRVEYTIIDNANAYYSERYGWTLRKN
jgi:hypothetical protein